MTRHHIDYVELAQITSARIARLSTSQEMTAELKRSIELHQVFFGVLPPEEQSVHILIKGKALLEEIVRTNRTRDLSCGAVFVSCWEEAIAMREVFGDGEDTSLSN